MRKQTSETWPEIVFNVITALAIIFAVLAFSWLLQKPEARKLDKPEGAPLPKPELDSRAESKIPDGVQRNIGIKSFSWIKPPFAALLYVNLIITNNSAHAVDQVKVICNEHDAAGTAVGSLETILYETVPAHTEKRFDNLVFGPYNTQMASFSMAIERFKLVDSGAGAITPPRMETNSK